MENIDFNSISLFQGKRLGDLMQEVYLRSKEKEESIKSTIDTIANMMTNQNTAIMFAPVISQFVEAGVKNDDQLIKLISLIQKFVSTKMNQDDNSTNIYELTDEEKESLMNKYQELVKSDSKTNDIIKLINVPSS